MVCCGYRWAASLDLKQSRDLAATISWGRLFHSGMVRGKNGMYVCMAWRGVRSTYTYTDARHACMYVCLDQQNHLVGGICDQSGKDVDVNAFVDISTDWTGFGTPPGQHDIAGRQHCHQCRFTGGAL